MKNDISNIIDLDKVFQQSNGSVLTESYINGVPTEVAARIDLVNVYGVDQKVVDSMTTNMVLTEHAKYLNRKAYDSINIDSILTEWSWRCDKGYPDYNSVSDRLVLQQVLDEMKIPLPFERLTEAADAFSLFSDNLIQKFEEFNKLGKFKEYAARIPDGIVKKIAIELNAISNSDKNVTDLVNNFNSTTLTAVDNLVINTGIFSILYDITPKGIGPGEVLLSWLLGAPVIGGSASYDIAYENEKIEVKALTNNKKTNSMEPGSKYASIEQYALTDELKNFFKNIVTPYYLGNPVKNKKGTKDTLRFVIESLASDKNKDDLTYILNAFEKIPSTSATEGVALSDTIREMTPKLFDAFYNAITEIHSKINSIKELENLASIEVQTDIEDVQFWIGMEDAKDIVNNAGKSKNVSIKVGDKVESENEKAKIWLTKFMKNKFIKDPKYFVNQLRAIRNRFITKEDGNKTKLVCIIGNKFKVYDNMDEFFTSSITRSNYRFDLKTASDSYKEYKYAQEQ
jgi:hypothetical protein